MKIWFDGEIKDLESAKISSLAHTLHYGTGVFEGIRSYATEDGVFIFRLHDHIRRLFDSAKILGIKIPYSQRQVMQACVDVIHGNNLKDAYIRPLVMFGHGGMGLDVEGERSNPVQILVAAWEWSNYFAPDMTGLNVYISDWQRIFPHGKAVQAKAVGNYLNSYMAYMDAKKKGYDEAVLVDSRGYLAEASASNLFILKDDVLYTPHITNALDGITRNTIICLAREQYIPVVELDMKISWLKDADEAFLTGTACELAPISTVNGNKLRGGPVASRLADCYRQVVHQQYEFGAELKKIAGNWYEPVEENFTAMQSALIN